VARSAQWIRQPDIWRAAAEDYALAIRHYETLAGGAAQASVTDALRLAHLSSDLQSLHGRALNGEVAGLSAEEIAASAEAFRELAQQAKAAADSVLDAPTASLEERLTATTLGLYVIDAERRLAMALPHDGDRIAELNKEYRRRVEEAIALIPLRPPGAGGAVQNRADEPAPMTYNTLQSAYAIYTYVAFVARVVDGDAEAAAAADEAGQWYAARFEDAFRSEVRHAWSNCGTMRIINEAHAAYFATPPDYREPSLAMRPRSRNGRSTHRRSSAPPFRSMSSMNWSGRTSSPRGR
jgi:hypothetical protein